MRILNLLFFALLLELSSQTVFASHFPDCCDDFLLSEEATSTTRGHLEPTDFKYSPCQNGLRLDLHGKTRLKAESIVKDVVQKAYGLAEGKTSIHFICGRGKHKNPNGKRGVIWNLIPQWLEDPSVKSYIESYQKELGTYTILLKAHDNESPTQSKKFPRFEILQELIQYDVPQSYYWMAELYLHGNQVKQNYTTAVVWLKRAVKHQLPEAQFRLGWMTAMGYGTKYNPVRAAQLYEKAGQQEISEGYINLAMMYFIGEGVPQNYKQSYRTYILAAKLNHPKAYNMLGIMTRKGLGIPANLAVAVLWDQKGALAGEPHAMVNFGVMLIQGDGITKDPVTGANWLKQAAHRGIPEGQMRFGLACAEGEGVQQNLKTAEYWLRQAIQNGDPKISGTAQYHLYKLIIDNKIRPDQVGEARSLLQSSANQKCPDALYELGHCYRYGSQGFDKNTQTALTLYREAASNNHAGAYYAVWAVLSISKGTFEDKEALFYLNKSAQLGYCMATAMLYGTVPPDVSKFMQEVDKKSENAEQHHESLIEESDVVILDPTEVDTSGKTTNDLQPDSQVNIGNDNAPDTEAGSWRMCQIL